MKRIGGIVIIALVAASLAAAEPLSTLSAKDPRSMALGGSFISLGTGYEALAGNPAAFARDRGELSIADLSAWTYIKPTEENIAKLAELSGSEEEVAATLNDFITDNGFGGGLALGIGYTGRGLGIGTYLVADSAIAGTTLMGAQMRSAAAFNAVLGLAAPIRLGALKLSLGGDVRPFFRADSDGPWAFSEIFGALMGEGAEPVSVLEGQKVVSGFGLAMDFGARLELGKSLSIGLALRDLAPSYLLTAGTLSDLLDALSAGTIPEPDSTDSERRAELTPFLTAGIALTPRLIPYVLEPALYVELQDPIAVIKDNASFWTMLHAGAELKLLSLISLRAGLNRGWPSAGVGLDLLFVHISASVFTEELGRRPGDAPRSGASLGVAIRF